MIYHKAPLSNMEYCLVLDKKQRRDCEKHYGFPKRSLKSELGDGRTFFMRSDRLLVCIVSIDEPDDTLETMSLLVHEVVHVYNAMVQNMADDSPSDEFAAYSVQKIFYALVSDLKDYLESKNG